MNNSSFEQNFPKKHYFENAPYPEHLKEAQRLEMMLDIMKHEVKKQPGLSSDEYMRREEEIDGWLTEPEKYQMGGGLRDVMNKIWADFKGFKLKFGIIEILTASNTSISEEVLPLDSLSFMDYFTTKVLSVADDNASISGTSGSMTVAEVRNYFEQHPDQFNNTKEQSTSHFEIDSVARENDKIIVYKTKDEDGQERLVVLDGNGRVVRKITQAPQDTEQTIQAYVITKMNDEPLQDYWIPTSRFADKLEEGSRAKSDVEKVLVKKQIFDLFRLSPGVGPVELERAASVNPQLAQEVLQEWSTNSI